MSSQAPNEPKKKGKKKNKKKDDYAIDISEGNTKKIFGSIEVPEDMTYMQFILIKLHIKKFEDQEEREARKRRQNRRILTPEEKKKRGIENWKKLRNHVIKIRYTPNFFVKELILKQDLQNEVQIEGINLSDEDV
mgnify:CR=1 FL=1